MKIATSLAAPVFVSLLCAGISAPSLASAPFGKSLVDRCMSEPVANDHLSCGSVYRQAYVRARLKSRPSVRAKQIVRRHTEFAAVRFVRPKPAFRRSNAPTVRTARATTPVRRPNRERGALGTGTFSLASATPPLVVLHPHEKPQSTARLHQASALCGQRAYRSSWECGRYFLLAPYASKSSQQH